MLCHDEDPLYQWQRGPRIGAGRLAKGAWPWPRVRVLAVPAGLVGGTRCRCRSEVLRTGWAGALGSADRRPAPRATGRNMRPAPRAPESPAPPRGPGSHLSCNFSVPASRNARPASSESCRAAVWRPGVAVPWPGPCGAAIAPAQAGTLPSRAVHGVNASLRHSHGCCGPGTRILQQ